MLSRIFVLIASIATTIAFLSKTLPSTSRRQCNLVQMVQESSTDQRRKFIGIPKILSSGIISFSLLYGQYQPVLHSQVSNEVKSSSLNFIQPAHADFRAAQKRTYFRFIPKLEIGLNYYANDLKKAIDEENYDVIKTLFDEFVVKVNPNDPNQIDAKDTYVNEKFYRPMVVFSGTFAERGTSVKQRLLLEQKDLFATAMGDLEGCTKDRREGGLFGKEIKMPTGSARKTQVHLNINELIEYSYVYVTDNYQFHIY